MKKTSNHSYMSLIEEQIVKELYIEENQIWMKHFMEDYYDRFKKLRFN